MSLREHLGEGGGGRKEEAADSPAGSTGTCPGKYFPPDSCPLPSLHLASWEVGMPQAFADSSFISNDSLSLLRSRCCLSPARSWEMLKSIHAHVAIEERGEPVVPPPQRGKCGQLGIWRAARGTKSALQEQPLVWRPHKRSQPRSFLVCRDWTKVHYVCSQALWLGESCVLENITCNNGWLPIYLPMLIWVLEGADLGKPNEILILPRNNHWGADWELINFSVAKRKSGVHASAPLFTKHFQFGKVGGPIWA